MRATIPSTGVTLNQFQRSEPYHGASPYWLANLNRSGKLLAVNGRVTYVDGKRNFIMDENAFGGTPLGTQNQLVSWAAMRRVPRLPAIFP